MTEPKTPLELIELTLEELQEDLEKTPVYSKKIQRDELLNRLRERDAYGRARTKS